MVKEYEKFFGSLIKVGDSIMITIPAKIVKHAGLEKHDTVKVMIQKHSIFEDE